VRELARFASDGGRYFAFARAVEGVTTSKKGNLILNVDGAIAAILLDILESELNYTQDKLQELVDIEFFNALFVLARSVGFSAHYLDQRRHDEGLLRLSPSEIRYLGE
jgi:citrate synthase